jgi:hypothetical protein
VGHKVARRLLCRFFVQISKVVSLQISKQFI